MKDAHNPEADDDWPPSRSAVQDALDVLAEEGCVKLSRAAEEEALDDVTPKGSQNFSPMQMAVLAIVLEFGGTPDEIARRLSAEYEQPPTRQSVVEACKRSLEGSILPREPKLD